MKSGLDCHISKLAFAVQWMEEVSPSTNDETNRRTTDSESSVWKKHVKEAYKDLFVRERHHPATWSRLEHTKLGANCDGECHVPRAPFV